MTDTAAAGGVDDEPAIASPRTDLALQRVSGVADYLADLDSEDPRPPSRQIADQLRSAILSGRLQPDAKLPSQNQLSSRYGVARETVKAALRQLASEGLIVSRKGSGSFVSAHDVSDSHSPALSRSVPKRFISALEGLKEVHDEAASMIQEMPDSQQAFDCSTRLFSKLRELAEATADLRAETAVRVASENREKVR
ncbi:GntR family transcriptional regulator [Spirillospora sp. CA-255316]